MSTHNVAVALKLFTHMAPEDSASVHEKTLLQPNVTKVYYKIKLVAYW